MTDVLIVGAGPTGLVLALALTKQGVSVRIIDKDAGPGETSRAMAVQARTLELYRQLGLAERLVQDGFLAGGMNFWANGEHKARIPIDQAGTDLTPFPFVLIYPQDKHERVLVNELSRHDIHVERHTEFVAFEEKERHVSATLRLPNGQTESVSVRYLAGCDGAKSTLRQQLGAGFEGGTYSQIFYVADVVALGLEPPGEAHIALDTADFVAILPYDAKGGCRLIGTVSSGIHDSTEQLKFEDISHKAIEGLKLQIEKVNWFSTYRVHHRVTDNFRVGRVFLAGDAAHVHSPAGGQGMNTGIGDAFNLAWKLAAVLKDQCADPILDSYQQERQTFAHKLVDTTDRVFTFMTAKGNFADFIRTKIAPNIASMAYGFEDVREFMFKMVSQITLNYHDSVLSDGLAGKIRGGDRLPWLKFAEGDNFDSLNQAVWQIHVYGEPTSELTNWCRSKSLPLIKFAWEQSFESAGFSQNAAYLIRPDTYVAVANQDANVDKFESYVRQLELKFEL